MGPPPQGSSGEDESKQKDMADDEPDPSKLSLSEKLKLFNQRPLKMDRRKARFQTQPVTSKEVETASRISPPRTAAPTNASSTETGTAPPPLGAAAPCDSSSSDSCDGSSASAAAKRGILISSTGNYSPETPRKSMLKRRKSPPLGAGRTGETLKSILKQDSTECNSGSDTGSTTVTTTTTTTTVSKNVRYESSSSANVFDSSDVLSSEDGDSSGAQEVQRIMGTARDKDTSRHFAKQFHHQRLSKSKSHGAVTEDPATVKMSIAERRAALEHFGDTEWKKRQSKLNSANEELNNLNFNLTNKATTVSNETLPSIERSATVGSILAARKEELENSAKKWKNRVEITDANNFSVAGRMKNVEFQQEMEKTQRKLLEDLEKHRSPLAKTFKGTGIEKSKTTSSISNLVTTKHHHQQQQMVVKTRKIQVHRPDDETFTNFYANSTININNNNIDHADESIQFSKDDLDAVQRIPENNLLSHKKAVKIQKRRTATSKNPVKALAARTDLLMEYNEIITGIAVKEMQRINIEKLDNKSNMAVEALAGLISKEDFSNVSLKKTTASTSPYLQYKDMVLMQVKGRRHVQTRIVEPVASSINEGDNYLLITPNALYVYTGRYSNVIEQSKSADIASYVQLTNDMGCKTNRTINVASSSVSSRDLTKFWSILGAPADHKSKPAGHPDEDELYEASITKTNKVFRMKTDTQELEPVEEYWGSVPRYQLLQSDQIFVFDFGSEMYVWCGKNANIEDKKTAYNLATQMWGEGYNYTECSVCPVNAVDEDGVQVKQAKKRPEWTLFTRITQHMEPIVFKEKFVDWPDFNRDGLGVEEINKKEYNKSIGASVECCDVDEMLRPNASQPDLALDGSSLGRGTEFYDNESNRLFMVTTLDLTTWHISDYSNEKLDESSLGQFYSGDSYVIRWKYQLTVMGRELSGKPSKYGMRGRDRAAYFCWQGKNALVSEKGAAALLTVELDSEHARQINVTQGYEPPAFLNLWKGQMTVHDGRRDSSDNDSLEKPRLFYCKGVEENETVLTEVSCKVANLRSRNSLVLVLSADKKKKFIVWHGKKSSKKMRELCRKCAEKIIKTQPKEFGFFEDSDIDSAELEETEEGEETAEFAASISGDLNKDYYSLKDSSLDDVAFDYTPRLFHFASTAGSFQAHEILCPFRKSDEIVAYPFSQCDLYNVNQPALFMLDNGYELWLWQGWFPVSEENDEQMVGSVPRWRAERKAAMQTVLNYWNGKHKNGQEPIPAYLVFAGLEPLTFTNLFPEWERNEQAAAVNAEDRRKEGETLNIETELNRLNQTTYPLEQILQRPLPEGVDPSRLEDYLSPDDFRQLLSMTKTEFLKLPTWKQTAVKKDKGLF